MREDGKISAGQLFTLAFLSRIIIMITVDSRLSGGQDLLDLTFSALWYLGLNLVLILPVWLLHRRYPKLDILEVSCYSLGKWGKGAAVLYGGYLLFMSGYFLSVFQLFMENEVSTTAPVWVLSAALVLVSCYGAFMGLESIARTGGFLFLLVCAGLLFLLVTLNQELRSENFTPLFYHGTEQMIQGTLLFLSRSTFYLVLPLLLPRTVGTLRLKYVLWNGGLALFFIVMIVTVCGALGPMAGLESFPMYTMASLAQSGPFQRLDAVYVAVWMMGLFLTLALDLYLVSVCAGRLFGKKAEKPAIPVCGVVLAVFPLLMTVEIREAAFSLAVLLMATLAIGVVFPMILLGLSKRKERKQR